MAPAFSSTKQAGAFALLLLLLLLLPVLAGKKQLPPREQAYAAQGWGAGPYPWIRQQIFEETNDIDIAFVGSSHLLWGIDTPSVQAALSKKLGRRAVVRSISWGGPGFDGLYFITKDLLEHRRVKLLVFYDESRKLHSQDNNALAPTWFRFADNAEDLAGLPWKQKTPYYFAAVIGMPRNLLCRLRPNLPGDLLSPKPNYMERQYHTENPAILLGAIAGDLGSWNAIPLMPFKPNPGAQPADASIYSPQTQADFSLATNRLPALDIFFARKFTALAQEHGGKLVLLSIPTMDESPSQTIAGNQFWPQEFPTNVTLLGVPPAKLFADLGTGQIERLFSSSDHLNKNGQAYFTSVITPKLIEIYDTQTHP